MKRIITLSLFHCFIVSFFLLSVSSVYASTYYIAPDKDLDGSNPDVVGDDGNDGFTQETAWRSFDRAWQDLDPGDTLILLDGIYRQSLHPNVRDGQPGNPITVRANNDGKAIIDGEYQRIPVTLGESWPGPIGNYFVIEGIVARNSSGYVVGIYGHHNTIRRVSAYNANPDTNSSVMAIMFTGAQHNLIEDSVAAGSGRKMLVIFKGENNILRRNFVDWRQWDGREWHDCWPWGDGIEIYNASYNIIENSISYSRNPTWSISLLSQGNPDVDGSIGNKILGSMAILAGMQENSTPMSWGEERPQPTEYTCVRDFNWEGQRAGFHVYERAALRDNLFQDIFAWGNAGLGLTWNDVEILGNGNNRVIRATLINNGLDNPDGPWPGKFGGVNTDALQNDLNHFDSIEDSNIANILIDWSDYPSGLRNMTSLHGQGAQLANQYINGVLTNEPLWPWPMEERIREEFANPDIIGAEFVTPDFSVTNTIYPILAQYSAVPSGTPIPTTPTPSTQPLKPGDTDQDGDVDISDLSTLLATFGSTGSGLSADFDQDQDVDISDLSTLLANFGS